MGYLDDLLNKKGKEKPREGAAEAPEAEVPPEAAQPAQVAEAPQASQTPQVSQAPPVELAEKPVEIVEVKPKPLAKAAAPAKVSKPLALEQKPSALDQIIKPKKQSKALEAVLGASVKEAVAEAKQIAEAEQAREEAKIEELKKAGPGEGTEELIKEAAEEAKELEITGKKHLLTSYGDVKIYRVEGEDLPVYSIPVIKPTGPEKIIVNTIKEAATRLITISPEEIRDPEKRRDFFFKRIQDIIESSPELGVPRTQIKFYTEMVVREMIGFGILDPLIKDDKLEEIMVIGPRKPVYIAHRDYDVMKTNLLFAKDDEIRNIIDRIARQVNRRVDQSAPMMDARLIDGSRVNATIPPISIDGSSLTIRKFKADPYTIVDLINFGATDTKLAAFMWLCVDGLGAKPANIIVAGGTGSGKTTTLNCLASFIPSSERVLSIEDTAELQLPIDHWIRFETRVKGLEGTGEVSMEDLLKNSLRMRPDRIVVGEVRGAEAETLFTAINTGHDGSVSTIHANSAKETVVRLQSSPMNVPNIMLGALHFILLQKRIYDRRKGSIRRWTELGELQKTESGAPQVNILFRWNPVDDTFEFTGTPSRYIQELQQFTGLSSKQIQQNVDERAKILDRLVKTKTRSLDEVKEEFRNYYASKRVKK
ncbi:MAG: CpaF family protein [DPANN group archaeon]|nr:CpaF family protein [DPANN group archaeon]